MSSITAQLCVGSLLDHENLEIRGTWTMDPEALAVVRKATRLWLEVGELAKRRPRCIVISCSYFPGVWTLEGPEDKWSLDIHDADALNIDPDDGNDEWFDEDVWNAEGSS